MSELIKLLVTLKSAKITDNEYNLFFKTLGNFHIPVYKFAKRPHVPCL
jgi:hypothetical protein